MTCNFSSSKLLYGTVSIYIRLPHFPALTRPAYVLERMQNIWPTVQKKMCSMFEITLAVAYSSLSSSFV